MVRVIFIRCLVRYTSAERRTSNIWGNISRSTWVTVKIFAKGTTYYKELCCYDYIFYKTKEYLPDIFVNSQNENLLLLVFST